MVNVAPHLRSYSDTGQISTVHRGEKQPLINTTEEPLILRVQNLGQDTPVTFNPGRTAFVMMPFEAKFDRQHRVRGAMLQEAARSARRGIYVPNVALPVASHRSAFARDIRALTSTGGQPTYAE